MTDMEYGRPTKFYWNERDFDEDNSWFTVWIGDQDTSIKCIKTTYDQLKRFVEHIEQQKKELSATKEKEGVKK